MSETCWFSTQRGNEKTLCRGVKLPGQVWCLKHYPIVEDGDELAYAPNRIVIRTKVGAVVAVPNPMKERWLIVYPWQATRVVVIGSEKSMRRFVKDEVEERYDG